MATKEQLRGHVIVCGYGIAGERVVDILIEHGIKLIVIEKDDKKVEILKERGVNVMQGDATSSRTLKEAGVANAKAIAITMDDDAKNLFTVVTAKSLNEKIIIATRANDEFLKGKLKDAGADFISTPNQAVSDEVFEELSKGL